MAYSGVIAFLMTILTPVIYIVNALSFLLLKLFRIDPNSAAKQMTEKNCGPSWMSDMKTVLSNLKNTRSSIMSLILMTRRQKRSWFPVSI